MSQKYFSNIFPNLQIEWKEIYLLPYQASIDNYLCMLQYKILKNIFCLQKQLSIFNKKDTKLCSYCRLQDETTNHIFIACKFAMKLWNDLKDYCQSGFDLAILCPQSATFGFFEIDLDVFVLLNHIVLLCKCYIYSSRDSPKLSFAAILKNIKKDFDLEKKYINRK